MPTLLNNSANPQPSVVQELRIKLRVMLDKRRPSKDNVIHFGHASERSSDAAFLDEYQALTGMVAAYFYSPDDGVVYEDYHYLKEGISELEQAVKGKRRNDGRDKVGAKADEFTGISSRVRVAGIEKLGKNQLEQAYMAAQQMEAEVAQQEQAAVSQLQSEQEGMDPDEVKTEKELSLQAELPFKSEKKLLQTLKTDLENALRSRQTSTPTMAR